MSACGVSNGDTTMAGCSEAVVGSFRLVDFFLEAFFFDLFCSSLSTTANASTVSGGRPSLASHFGADLRYFRPQGSVTVQWPSVGTR